MRGRKLREGVGLTFLNIFFIALCFVTLIPILYALSVSLNGQNALLSSDFSFLPKDFTLDNYLAVFTGEDILTWFGNSVILAAATVAISLAAAVPAAFFASDLGKRLLASPEIHREFKFSLLVPASDYGPGLEGEEVLLQGVIDCWFAEGDGLTVLDFKNDRIRPGGEGIRAEEYRPQLEAYSRALERVTGRKVFRRVLWFFATGQPWEL